MSHDPLTIEHQNLLDSSRLLLQHLHSFRDRMLGGRVAHHQHLSFAERSNSLAIYLDAGLKLVFSHLYPPAFTVLRSALEHHIMDLALFLGQRYEETIRNVDEQTWQEWQADREAGEDWTADIVSWERDDNTVTIVRSGLHERGGKRGPRAPALSRYFFWLDDYDPFAGKPTNQPHLATGFHEPELFVNRARSNRKLYHEALKWSALKESLRINRLYGKRALAQLDVHYTFLSAFTHPTKAGYELVYGTSLPSGGPRYDHYSSELCLLYCIAIASAELTALERMSRRTPKLALRKWEQVEGDVSEARKRAAHLWFPPDGRPHEFDRIEEAHRRFARGYGKDSSAKVVDPRSLTDRAIRYYRNPLRRLIRMHESSTEWTTGLTYHSPWERRDARFRT
jgi:hypothetical protein